MSKRIVLLTALAALSLGATASALELPSNLPTRKPGLWETTIEGTTQALPKMCIDASTDHQMYQMGARMAGARCSKMDIKVDASGAVVADSVCIVQGPTGPVTMSSHSITRFTGNTAYQTTSHMTYSPAVMGRSSADVTSSGRWVGPCAAGQKPGDLIMPDGSVHSVGEMMQEAPAAGGN